MSQTIGSSMVAERGSESMAGAGTTTLGELRGVRSPSARGRAAAAAVATGLDVSVPQGDSPQTMATSRGRSGAPSRDEAAARMRHATAAVTDKIDTLRQQAQESALQHEQRLAQLESCLTPGDARATAAFSHLGGLVSAMQGGVEQRLAQSEERISQALTAFKDVILQLQATQQSMGGAVEALVSQGRWEQLRLLPAQGTK